MPPYVLLEKKVGETPLACAEAWRNSNAIDSDIPLSYAGRLDPMASGKLLVLIGEECKNQTAYHGLDKAYDFSILFGIGSDTHDVLGRLHVCDQGITAPDMRSKQESPFTLKERLTAIVNNFIGSIELPYPHFSAKTVNGKPLHQWTLEGRLGEIKIPTKQSEIYSLECTKLEILARTEVAHLARTKIDTIPEVTDPRKALGEDFRRSDVRRDWADIAQNTFKDSSFNSAPLPETYLIGHFHAIASSGTYMRTLARVIAEALGTCGLAWHIHRTNIGTYDAKTKQWLTEF